jgi:MFS transporter, PPP family, 3-phenylpropionic acid transporter
LSAINLIEDRPAAQRTLWSTRFYYLMWFASSGFVFPFISLFYVSRGLSGTEIGIISSVISVMGLALSPFWANRNEHWRNPRAALQVFIFVAGLLFLWLNAQSVFWGMVLINVLQAAIGAGISPISDALALRIVEETKVGYGSIRVFGSLGWVIFVLMAGWIIERTNISASLIGACIFALISAVCLFAIPVRYFRTVKVGTETSPRAGVRHVIGKLLQKPTMVGAGLLIVFFVIASSGIFQFQGVYLKQLGAPESLIGVAGMLAAVVELPFMLWSDKLMHRWGSYRVLLAGMLIYAVVRTAILISPTIPVILVSELFAGISYSFYVVAVVKYISEEADPSDTRTILALYTVTLPGLIGIIIGPISGAAFDRLGALSLYVIGVVGFLLAALVLYLSKRVDTQRTGVIQRG